MGVDVEARCVTGLNIQFCCGWQGERWTGHVSYSATANPTGTTLQQALLETSGCYCLTALSE